MIKREQRGNAVGPGPAMLIAGIFPAPPTPAGRLYVHACTSVGVCVCIFCLRKWSFYSVRKFRLSAAVADLPAQRVETFRVLLVGGS